MAALHYTPIIKQCGLCEYQPIWDEMKDFTSRRDAETRDEFWSLEHYPVFTQGQAGLAEHVLKAGDVPVVRSDRGGQVTYHAPGQLVVYVLLNLHRLGLGIRSVVTALENAVIRLLAEYNIEAQARRDAPGVYVSSGKMKDAKICSVGLRVRKGCTYHGLALNVDMDLEPFSRINPCGIKGLHVTQLRDLVGHGNSITMSNIAIELCHHLQTNLGYIKNNE